MAAIQQDDFARYREHGFFVVKKLISDSEIPGLQQRLDDIMDGKVRYPDMEFQADTSTGNYDDVKHGRTDWLGPSRNYRKIKGFEVDPMFREVFTSEPIKKAAAEFIGPRVSVMRAMMMNKPAHAGTHLPWHQDVSSDWPMTGMPTFTVWIALDEATKASGCLEVAVGSHKHGRIGNGHYLKPETEDIYAPESKRAFLEISAGDAIVFDCALLHRSAVNTGDQPRRGMTLCLLDADIRNTRTGKTYPILFDGN
jgi:ectoine hydroxylase-related dioxygenase (phytanoyl-CoA dioxygenase family)